MADLRRIVPLARATVDALAEAATLVPLPEPVRKLLADGFDTVGKIVRTGDTALEHLDVLTAELEAGAATIRTKIESGEPVTEADVYARRDAIAKVQAEIEESAARRRAEAPAPDDNPPPLAA